MAWDLTRIPSLLRPALEERLSRVENGTVEKGTLPFSEMEKGSVPFPTVPLSALPVVWACSDFVAEACLRDASLLPWLGAERRLLEGVTK